MQRPHLVMAAGDATTQKGRQDQASELAFQPGWDGAFREGQRVGKYSVKRVLGRGAAGITYEAEASPDHPTIPRQTVALKCVSLRNMRTWKAMDLIEREARVLQSLSHPAIPAYVEYFQLDDAGGDGSTIFCLAQKLAKGQTLEALVKERWSVDDSVICAIAIRLLEVLSYLHSQRPPIIHRDIKPANIVVDRQPDEGNGEQVDLSLVDFGGVTSAVSSQSFGSTLVGTFGYMAPEQFRGVSSVQSDLYSVGATLLYLITGQEPSTFPEDRLRIDFSSALPKQLSPSMKTLVAVTQRLVEPAPQDRYASADDALRDLQQRLKRPEITQQIRRQIDNLVVLRRPKGTKVDVKIDSEGRLRIHLPPVGITPDMIPQALFGAAWNGIIGSWTFTALRAGAGIGGALFSLPFWAAGFFLAKGPLVDAAESTDLTIGPDVFDIKKYLYGVQRKRETGTTADLTVSRVVVEVVVNGVPQTAIEIQEGVNKYRFGRGLTTTEQHWISSQINAYILEAQRSPQP
ncbi:unnamed protein product [Vitrella brassicaformis CCMP3155]|uniref:non-specific serine/threonine protein kinase n=2 Tax=Vitrella brassicaformis TaxID=1169539 RepID=A0A0G4EJY6_VITBC|nr:unnamed protein product [Vitrella brassicaformis CCMP3155]|eukprot:CEL97062.1 unnamed protein product [Vitrella brassicaformis CCMP3155]